MYLMGKRVFDIIFSLVGLLLVGPFLLFFWILTSFNNKSNGMFIQERVGQRGELFRIYKLKTIHPLTLKISRLGYFLRKTKIDELPQLWNVLKGEMSIVGPRPDVAGYYDLLQGEYRKILELKPGLTSLASIKYFDEESILAKQEFPLLYNDTVIFPDKLRLNLKYYYNHSFLEDLKIIFITFFNRRL